MRLPLLPTILVGAAVATMIGLGVWQLERARRKDGLLATYAAAAGKPEMGWPTGPRTEPLPLFRTASGTCLSVTGWEPRAGHNRNDESGYSYHAQCRTGAEGPGMTVEAGWARRPDLKPSWTGGPVRGTIVPDARAQIRLVSAVGLGGLEAAAPVGVDSIPNNHRSYAFQWFAFALTALVIYVVALRRRGGTA